jgi:predicted RNase H-like HicB family nuclease
MQGRTVDEARRQIREALELFVDDAAKASIVDEVKLPSAATRAIRAPQVGFIVVRIE